ncbi:MAG TPA: MerR family transcriptional regulator [Candidatus Mediterraneibacter faecavium]|uniref:MerR family transcriptional regulator n=1 Tax=Candidatus Mediterraneibacter faecavium TaxID=2838668 RepID=A0A9D2TL72_9FIRM|nr:MerR family transcriptional regulator [Candidatus Mediterraneibacter faecavium]
MEIKRAEEATGVSRQNIRFYEKQGLLHPARNKRNSYREYSEEDILRLKQIRLFRKLGMPIEEIRRLLDGEEDFRLALQEQERRLAAEEENLKASRQFIRKIHAASLEEMDVDYYLRTMEEEEKKGAVFGKFAGDYKKTALAETKRSFGFHPDTMCGTPQEFTLELCKYANENDLDLVITKEGMTPEFTIDGIEYTAYRSSGRFGISIHCEMKHPEDYIPPDMPEDRYDRVRRIYRIVNVCFLLLIIVGGVYTWQGNAEALIIPLLAFAVYIGILIRWHQKKN